MWEAGFDSRWDRMITCVFEDRHQASFRHTVVDTVVMQDEKVLLVRRARSLLEGGKWALAGGYVERDETLAQAVAREVFEETGYRVSDITLLRGSRWISCRRKKPWRLITPKIYVCIKPIFKNHARCRFWDSQELHASYPRKS
ncbi:MAG: NUDIX hydrolase [Candidatus Sungbacteria bacterium]|uniref:NUDIX hydrolase n=1 Tax=Candidatus Sungiibacteriota bacterium TaxID=2750080 RepID=A0A932VRJ6_9BACT|nr:NUDIX hydrolase [Candidatus Sungbacteria bacterium]